MVPYILRKNVEAFVFHTPTKITFGQGVASAATDAIEEISDSRIILITDKQLLKTDLVNYLIAQWQSQHHLCVFSDVLSDANLTGVNEAVRLAKNEKCNAIMALGGGSVID